MGIRSCELSEPQIKIFGKRRVRDPIPRFPIFQTNFITLPDLDFGKRASGNDAIDVSSLASFDCSPLPSALHLDPTEREDLQVRVKLSCAQCTKH